jgi:cobalt-zinc-cadmium efflux system protein
MHSHGPATGARLWASAAVTGAFVVVEAAAGWWANSLALLSDAGHNLVDVAALVLGAWAFRMATRPATAAKSYGFHRVGVLAALVNAATLLLVAGYIFYEGYQRLVEPEPVQSLPVIVVAAVALALNLAIARALHHGHGDLNVRAALVHMVGDAVAAVGVILAGLLVWLTGSTLWDPVVSLLIGAFILWSSWGILRESVAILMESTPGGVQMERLVRDVEAVPGVRSLHDLHVWSLASNLHALSAHLVVENPETATNREVVDVVRRVKHVLADRHGIAHATLETHCSTCEDDCLACDLAAHRAHQHPH